MDTVGSAPVPDRLAGFRSPAAGYGVAGLSLRLTALQRAIERDYPVVLALDIVNRDAVDGLPPDLTAILHALLEEGALNAARHSGAAFTRLCVQVNGGVVLLSVVDDGRGFPFAGIYDLSDLRALGAGPRWLVERVAELNGSMTLDTRPGGSRIDIVVSREAAVPRQVAAAAAA